MELCEYTYNQLITLDMTCGGLTKKQAVLSRTLDRRWKKAHKNIFINRKSAKCRMERRVVADICGYYDELMGG